MSCHFNNLNPILEKIYIIIERIIEYQDGVINKKIKDLDIRAKIEEVDGLLMDMDSSPLLKSKISIGKVVLSLCEVIVKLQEILESISVKITEHHNKWFYYWRSVEFNSEIKELETCEKLLVLRYNRLKDLLKINWT